MIVGTITCPELIGRADELRELVGRRLLASQGHGALLVVTGDTGIGKSRLIAAFRDELQGRRTAFGVGYARSGGTAPYLPFMEASRSAGSSLAIPIALSRGEQLAAMADAIARESQRRNTVLVLEDLHWADAATLDLLSHLVPLLPSLRLLVVATYRTDTQLEAVTAGTLARLERHAVSRIALGTLSEPEIRRLLRLSVPNGFDVDAQALDEIVRRAEGNAFFAEELLKSALERKNSGGAGSLPLTIRGAVEERLRDLDEPTLTTAQQASIFGRHVDAALLAQLYESSGIDVLTPLRRLRDLRIIEETRGDCEAFSFKHALIRDVIYASMLARQAQPLHARLLRILESKPGSNVYDLAYQAAAANDVERSLFYDERAGDEASAVHAYRDAAFYYERALTVARMPAVRARLFIKAADVCARDGRAARAAELYSYASEEADSAGEKSRALELRGACAVQARLSGDNERAVSVLSAALAQVPASQKRLRAELALNLAFSKLDVDDITAAKALIDKAREAATPSLYWRAAAYAATVEGDLDQVRESSALRIASSMSFGRVATLGARFNLGFSLCALGADREALTVFDAILPEVSDAHLWSLVVLTCANVALIHARRGEFPVARAFVMRGMAAPEPSTTGPVALTAAALTLENMSGDRDVITSAHLHETAEAAFHSGIDSTLGRFAGPYARWLSAQHRESEARDMLSRAVALLHGPFGSTETLLSAVEFGDETTAERALALSRRIESMLDVPLYAATAPHLRALAARRRGGDADTASAAEAARRYEALGWSIHAARCREMCGARSQSTYHKLGARGELRRIVGLSAREKEIARLVADGLANKLIAERFNLSLRTIEKHLTSIYAKLGLDNRAQLVALVTRERARVS